MRPGRVRARCWSDRDHPAKDDHSGTLTIGLLHNHGGIGPRHSHTAGQTYAYALADPYAYALADSHACANRHTGRSDARPALAQRNSGHRDRRHTYCSATTDGLSNV